MSSKKIKIFTTGGTFDKEFNEIDGTLHFNQTHIREILDLGRCRLNIEIESLMMIDCLDMNESHRAKILNKCVNSKFNRIIITHGTDTLEETAQLLGSKIKNKTIIITGAMIPYKFGSSDGRFNFGSALSFVQCLNPGVYVAMNGVYFQYNNVRKNKKLGVFETIN